ncbi:MULTISPECIES: lysine N(6)-hydroxylase/L-ornithine N(5)-oxygenase family protein [unclassified Psychrobacter]|uniref:lysine N(6)-hydroxylase/L-ornithine N(5)-oxygenase family protein n=1 Tax=unclassified Psychrobacter TaxID=196806 RepID=UPI003FCF6AD6
MHIYDFIGIGFGPANLSVAVALSEKDMLNDNSKIMFIESKPDFVWHGGMLIPEAEMQISFFKDLVTFRNPTSPFTFINYLAENGRLETFANLKNFFPRRVEYNDYLQWAAKKFENYVKYATKVIKIEPVLIEGSDVVDYLALHLQNVTTKEAEIIYAKDISLAAGISKVIPEYMSANPDIKISHSEDFLYSLETDFTDKHAEYKFIVVGSGQSAAEITMHLADEYPNAKVDLYFRTYALKPADETEFVNEIFDSDTVETFLTYDDDFRENIIENHRNTNYSVVDPKLISILYERLYYQKLIGTEQIQLHQFHELKGIDSDSKQAIFKELTDNKTVNIEFDGLFLATGYEIIATDIVKNFEEYLVYDTEDRLVLDTDYRVKTINANFKPKIFIQGASEHSHGMSETLLSLLAYRSGKIVTRLSEND